MWYNGLANREKALTCKKQAATQAKGEFIMYTSATYESTKCIYSGKDWHLSVWGEYEPRVNVYDLTADECEKLAKLVEKAARQASDLNDIVTWATLAQGLRSSLEKAKAEAKERSAEAERKAAENAAAEATEAAE